MAQWSKILGLALIVFIIGWGFTHRQDLRNAMHLFHQLTWSTLFLLLMLQAIYTVCLAASNQGVYRALHIKTSLKEQLLLVLASGVANRLIPLGGISGISSFVYLAGKRGIRIQDSIQMTAVSTLLGYLQILPLVAILGGWGILHPQTGIGPSQSILTNVVLFVLLSVIGALLAVYLLSRKSLSQRLANTREHKLQAVKWIRDSLVTLSKYSVWSLEHSSELWGPLLFLLLLYPIRLIMLKVVFSSFHFYPDLVSIAIGYTLAFLASTLSFLPTNLGLFEAALITAYQSFGIPFDIATAVTLLYRSYTFWIPIPFGLAAYAFL